MQKHPARMPYMRPCTRPPLPKRHATQLAAAALCATSAQELTKAVDVTACCSEEWTPWQKLGSTCRKGGKICAGDRQLHC